MNSDINGVSTVISGTLTSIVSNILTIATSVFYLFYTDWRLAIVGIVIIPILIFPTKAVGKKRWELLSEAQEERDVMNQHVDETLSVSGSMLVKLFTREKAEYKNLPFLGTFDTRVSRSQLLVTLHLPLPVIITLRAGRLFFSTRKTAVVAEAAE